MLETKQSKLVVLTLGLVLILALILTVVMVRNNNQAVKVATREIFTGSTSTVPTYTDLKGNKLSLEDWLGEPIVVVSWASWSPFSADNLKSLDALAQEYSAKKIRFIAMNRKESKEQALRYLSTLTEFPHLTLVIDTEDLFYSAVAGYAMPETVIFNAKGDIILHEHGIVGNDLIRQAIDPLLQN